MNRPLSELPFPVEAYPLLRTLAREAPVALGALREAVLEYQRIIDAEAALNVVLDSTMALAIGDGCLALLDQLGEDPPSDDRWLVQLAVRYYVVEEDGASDLEAFQGFEDDALVFNTVARQLGRDDLLVVV